MAKTKGNKTLATILLGLTNKELQTRLKHPRLAHWKTADGVPSPPSDVEVLSRVEPEQLTSEELAIARAVDLEDRKFRAGLDGMALSEQQKDLAVAHQRSTGLFFRNMVQGMFGGMYSTYLECMSEQHLTRERLARIRLALEDSESLPYGSEQRAMMVAEEKSLAAQARDLGNEIIKVNEVGTKGAYLLAMVKQGKKAKGGKPAFKAPTTIDQ